MTDHDRPDPARAPARRRRLPVLASVSSLALAATFAWTGADVSGAQPTGTAPGTSAATTTSPAVAPAYEPPVVVGAGPVRSVTGGRAGGTEGLDDVPGPALAAYQRAAGVFDVAAPACRLEWTLLAAVGRVRSDHGERSGHRLTGKGTVRPALVGPAVRTRGGTRVADTDRGVLDGDRRTDRHVGPLLLTPSQWSLVGVDADDDGTRDPNDLDDAALAAAVLLCAEPGNLRSPAGARTALRALDSDPGFARDVLAVAAGYRAALAQAPQAFTVAAAPSTLPHLPAAPAPAAAAPDGDDQQQEVRPPEDGGEVPGSDGQALEQPVEPDPPTQPEEPEEPTDPPDEQPVPTATAAEATYDPATLTLTVTVSVVPETGGPAEGEVEVGLSRDGEALGTATVTLVDGTATYAFPDIAAGSYLLVATYAGTDAATGSAAELPLELE